MIEIKPYSTTQPLPAEVLENIYGCLPVDTISALIASSSEQAGPSLDGKVNQIACEKDLIQILFPSYPFCRFLTETK